MLSLEKTYLGIELGSTRIKAVLIDEEFKPVASGGYEWENRFENGYWTYSLDDIHNGIKGCFSALADDVKNKYCQTLTRVGAIGISAMMHGYMAFDKNDRLLVPFRTWRNTTTAQAANELTELLGFNIPQRWSAAHLYQAVLNSENHVPKIEYITTLAGYIQYLLTGSRAVGIGEASGIFPVKNSGYNEEYLNLMQEKLNEHGFDKKLVDIFPEIKKAGERGAFLTEKGAKFLDPSGTFESGIPVCPPEGDAGTGMVAANAVKSGTGNVSAGTSVFAMLVTKKNPSAYYPEIDMVTTPDGKPVAMVHCNNCCCELDFWVKLFGEFAELSGNPIDKSRLYELLYANAMKSAPDCRGLTAYNFLSGEPVAGVESGRPMYFRTPDSVPSLGAFFRAELYSAFAALKLGMDILFEKENMKAEKFTGHGGIFKVKGAAQQVLADALNTPVSVMSTAGEGGAWGMALLASYMINGGSKSLDCWLDSEVFSHTEESMAVPDEKGKNGFDEYMKRYVSGLSAEKSFAD